MIDDLTREKYADVDRDDAREQIRTSWHCTRCWTEWDSYDRDLLDSFCQHVVGSDACPECGREDASCEGDLPEERPSCCGCEAAYDWDAADGGRWETSDMEAPVCPACIAKWTAAGAGYYECSGCGQVLLSRQRIERHSHQRLSMTIGGSGSYEVSSEPCGQWQRVEELSR